ncbi:DUF222 domain-containing protein [Cnuibacter physcomitrellae]|uniref:DUF222 domain-containing protein n=1 Tax=Cnuibacter physcomitrellae TaxID=1619308 RepID=UPI002175E389|nr:DUF222 domain-containing protein [Cnuibacter physcomitrellae]MCS5495633.1 DUF222 domain-containing protein [Cnuibacter physcomitrellae]
MQRRSMTAEIAVALNVSERFVSSETCDAETITALPTTLDALARGDISRQHVHKLVTHLNTLPTEAWEAFEAAVLPAAQTFNPARFDNLAHLCRRHHRVTHATDWDVTQDPDRTLTWTSPLGQTTHTRPPGRDLTDATERAHAILRRAHDTEPDPELDPACDLDLNLDPDPDDGPGRAGNSRPRTSIPEPDDGPAMTARGREILTRIRTPRPLPGHAPF